MTLIVWLRHSRLVQRVHRCASRGRHADPGHCVDALADSSSVISVAQVRKFGAQYLVVQGVASGIWWLLMAASEAVRSWFIPTDEGWRAIRMLMPADLVLYGIGSVITGVLLRQAHRHTRIALWILTGVSAYATLVAISWIGPPVRHWLGAVVMIPAFAVTTAIAAVSETPLRDSNAP